MAVYMDFADFSSLNITAYYFLNFLHLPDFWENDVRNQTSSKTVAKHATWQNLPNHIAHKITTQANS